MRETGKLRKDELREWQECNGLQVDGLFGNQSMGVVLELEDEVKHLRIMVKRQYAHIHELRKELIVERHKYRSLQSMRAKR